MLFLPNDPLKLIKEMDNIPDFEDVFRALKKFCSNVLHLKKNDESGVVIRSDIKEISDVERFVDIYQTLTHTRFCVFKTKQPTRYIYRRQWYCHFNGRTRRIKEDYRCRGSIDIVIKKLSRYTVKKDPFLKLKPPLCTVIKIRYPHTHPVFEKKFLRKNKMTNEVKKIFYEYFEHNIVGINTKKLHLKLLRELKFPYLDDRCINPPLNVIYRLHRFWLKNVAPKDNIQSDPALKKEDFSLQFENIKKEDPCYDDFLDHIKETIIGLITFPPELSVDDPDTKLSKTEVVDDLCISDVRGNAIEFLNAKEKQRLSRLNHTMNQYRPIMPRPIPGKTNSKMVVPANKKPVTASVNPIMGQCADVLGQTPILFSKYGPLTVRAIMLQNIKS